MQNLKTQIADDLNLEDWQVGKLFDKFSEKIIIKAFKSTQNTKPGNRKYFKEALKHYTSYQNPTIKKWVIKPGSIDPSKFGEAKKIVEEVIDKHENDAIYTCVLCGKAENDYTLDFHSGMKHEYLIMKAHLQSLSPIDLDSEPIYKK